MPCFSVISVLILSLIIAPPIFGLFRPGKLVGGLADFLHGLNIRAHGFHLLIQGVVMGDETFRFGLPMLWGDFLTGRFQFVQIPHRSVIQSKFHAVRVEVILLPTFALHSLRPFNGRRVSMIWACGLPSPLS